MGENPDWLRFRYDLSLPEDIRNLFVGDHLNAQDERQNTVLHKYVCYGEHYDGVLEGLISRGTDLEILDRFGRTAFLLAVVRCKESMIRIFIDNGANVHIIDYLRQNALHYIAYPAKNHRTWKYDGLGEELKRLKHTLPFLKVLLEKGVEVNLQDNQLCTPLMYAAAGNYWLMVNILLKYGANVHFTNILSKNCLHLAATPQKCNKLMWHRVDLQTVAILIQNGACVNSFDDNKSTPLGCILKSTHRNKDQFAKGYLTAASLFYWRRRIDFCIHPGRILGELRSDDSLMSHVRYCYEEINRMRRFRLSEASNLCQFASAGVSEADRSIASVVSDRALHISFRETFPLCLPFIIFSFEFEYLQRKLMQITIGSKRRPTINLDSDINLKIASSLSKIELYNVLRASW